MPTASGVCICTTAHRPDNLRSWLLYHLALGFDHVYIYFDHPDGRDIAGEFAPEVTIKDSILPQEALPRAKQRRNLTDAIARASEDYQWILHIDTDELFHVFRGDLHDIFGGYDAGTFELVFDNLEVLKCKATYESYDYFRDEFLFRKRGKMPYLSYGNGKAAGNLAVPSLRERGVHRFGGDGAKSVRVEAERAVVLHYPFCIFEKWRNKRNIVDEKALLKGGLYEKSHRAIQKFGDDTVALKRFYRDNVYHADALKLLGDGKVQRISRPSSMIRYCLPTPDDSARAGPTQTAAKRLAEVLAGAASPRKRDKIRSLLMLSGGLFSTALLFHLLVGTRHRVHVHHIQRRHLDAGPMPDSEAAMAIVDYCWEHYPDFSYTTSVEDFQVGEAERHPGAILFNAARTCNGLGDGFDYVFTGNYRHGRTDLTLLEARRPFDACFAPGARKPEWLVPWLGRDAVEIYDAAPRELVALIWCCHQPVMSGRAYASCGRCLPCRTERGIHRLQAMRESRITGPGRPTPARAT